MNCLKCKLWFVLGSMLSWIRCVASNAYDYCMRRSLEIDKKYKCDQWKDITDAEQIREK